MPIISSIVSSIVNIFTKILPFLFAYKAGKNSAEKKELEDAIEKTGRQIKLNRILIVWLMMLSLASCGSVGVGKTYCSWVKPILISDNDQLTGGTARRILAHNETWNKFCN